VVDVTEDDAGSDAEPDARPPDCEAGKGSAPGAARAARAAHPARRARRLRRRGQRERR